MLTYTNFNPQLTLFVVSSLVQRSQLLQRLNFHLQSLFCMQMKGVREQLKCG